MTIPEFVLLMLGLAALFMLIVRAEMGISKRWALSGKQRLGGALGGSKTIGDREI